MFTIFVYITLSLPLLKDQRLCIFSVPCSDCNFVTIKTVTELTVTWKLLESFLSLSFLVPGIGI